MKSMRQAALAAVITLLVAAAAQAQPALTRVTGTVYNSDGTVAPFARLTIVRVIKGGVAVSTKPVRVTADAAGAVDFYVIRNSTAYIEGNVQQFEREGGVPVPIPDAAATTFVTLVPIANVPTSNLLTHAAVKGSTTQLGHLQCGSGVTCADGVISSNPVTDHGLLTGLADDDHPQYLTNARGDIRYAPLVHLHVISEVTGLQAALDLKAAAADLTAEASARAAADTTLQANIDAEAAARAAAITAASTADRARANHTGTQTLSTISDAGTAAALNAPASGNASAGEVVKGSDTRLTDARTPNSHATTHAAAGSDPVTLTQAQVTGLVSDLAGKQPLDSDLTAIAGLSPSADDVLQFVSGAWANRTAAQLKTSLGLVQADISGLTTASSPTFAGLTLTGPVRGADGTAAAPTFSFSGHTNDGFYSTIASTMSLALSGNFYHYWADAEYRLRAAGSIGWSSTSTPSAAADVSLFRDAAGTLALRNGTNPQSLRVYNTYTDASNYERGFAKWNTNVFEVGTESLGTGTARSLRLVSRGAAVMDFDSAGNISSAGSFATTAGSIVGRDSRVGFTSNSGLGIASDVSIKFSSTTSYVGTADLILLRDAAGVLALRNGTTAQSLRGYASYTDASNYTRWALTAATGTPGTITLAAESAGTGSANVDITLTPAGTGYIKTPKNAGAAFAVTVSGQNPVGWGRNSTTGGMSIFSGAAATPSDSNAEAVFLSTGIVFASTFRVGWSASNVTQAADSGLKRTAAGVVGVTNGSTGGGALQATGASGQPTCDSTSRGAMWTVQSASGAGDIFQVCMKGTADTYAWRSVFTAP